MNLLYDSVLSAFWLFVELDPAFLEIVNVSLGISFIATIIASIIGIPSGLLIAYSTFPGKRFVLTCLNTLLALPTVVIGLLVYSFISRRGMFGEYELLYTQRAIIIGQVILIWPLVTTLSIAAISKLDPRYRMTALTLGANHLQMAITVLKEAKYGICAAIVAAFGRVIAEVGISMMLGGNAKGFTRTMTTAMALEYDKGEFILAVALGITLMTIAFLINMLFHFFQGRTKNDSL